MQNRIHPLHADMIRKGIIFAEKCCNSVICLILYSKDRHIYIFLKTVKQFCCRIGNVIDFRAADVKIAICLRYLARHQIDYDNNRDYNNRKSDTVGPMPCA